MKILAAIFAGSFSIFALAGSTKAAPASSMPIPLVICDVFGRACADALQVSYCESRWRPWARNGQYRGIWQMGSRERHIYGDGPDALTQTRAAYRYFIASGKDWSPWSCKP